MGHRYVKNLPFAGAKSALQLQEYKPSPKRQKGLKRFPEPNSADEFAKDNLLIGIGKFSYNFANRFIEIPQTLPRYIRANRAWAKRYAGDMPEWFAFVMKTSGDVGHIMLHSAKEFVQAPRGEVGTGGLTHVRSITFCGHAGSHHQPYKVSTQAASHDCQHHYRDDQGNRQDRQGRQTDRRLDTQDNNRPDEKGSRTEDYRGGESGQPGSG